MHDNILSTSNLFGFQIALGSAVEHELSHGPEHWDVCSYSPNRLGYSEGEKTIGSIDVPKMCSYLRIWFNFCPKMKLLKYPQQNSFLYLPL